MENTETKLSEQITRIEDKLCNLADADRQFKLFGASAHKYRLNEVLSEKEIVDFENEFGIRLPEEYRIFLKSIGNGGAGPFYGLETLQNSLYEDLDHKNEKLDPSKPFPHTQAWNLDFENLPDDTDFEGLYNAKEHSNGLLRLSNYGCGVFISLVVNGERYGNMWMDDRCNEQGIYPFADFDEGTVFDNINFLDWYERWLDKSLAEIE